MADPKTMAPEEEVAEQFAAAGIGISQRMVSTYRLALAASLDGTPEGTELARQFKYNFKEYATLSAQYLTLVEQVAKLRMHPDQIEGRYAALDAAFDKLQDEKMSLMDEELRSYWTKRVKDGPVTLTMRE